MSALSVKAVIQVWERGEGHHPVEQALILLDTVFPEKSREELAQWSIGRRDAGLLDLHEQVFGPDIQGRATCAECGEMAEFQFTVSDIRAGPEAPAESRALQLTAGGFELTFRPPNSVDLAIAAAQDSAEGAYGALATRCVLEAKKGARSLAGADLPEEVLSLLAERISQADPQAEVLLNFTCPACGHRHQLIYDVVSCLWTEIGALARRLLHEVHLLARFYGWTEAEILGMSARRRQAYLEMIEG